MENLLGQRREYKVNKQNSSGKYIHRTQNTKHKVMKSHYYIIHIHGLAPCRLCMPTYWGYRNFILEHTWRDFNKRWAYWHPINNSKFNSDIVDTSTSHRKRTILRVIPDPPAFTHSKGPRLQQATTHKHSQQPWRSFDAPLPTPTTNPLTSITSATSTRLFLGRARRQVLIQLKVKYSGHSCRRCVNWRTTIQFTNGSVFFFFQFCSVNIKFWKMQPWLQRNC